MTTAEKTDFVFEKIEVGPYIFYFDGNQKITAGNGDFDSPEPNAFSLIQVQDCPWSTPTCQKTCYVHNLEKFQEAVHEQYRHNSAAIRHLLSRDEDDWGYYWETVQAFGAWISTNAKGGFRWHVSGDIFSWQYAMFIADVCRDSPHVQHWIYTRSFPLLGPILNIDNLTVNLSADKDNYWLARKYAFEHDLRVCYLTVDGEVPDDLHSCDVIFPDYSLRGVGQRPFQFRQDSEFWQSLTSTQRKLVCPVDQYGKSEKVRCGPCNKCMVQR